MDYNDGMYIMDFSNYSDPELMENIDASEHEDILNLAKYLINVGIVLVVFSLVGNTFVLFHIARNPQLRKKRLLFLNLSLADILSTLTVHLFMVISIWTDFNWLAGNTFCKIFICAKVLSEAGSINAILTIIIDEFLMSVRPQCSYIPKLAILGSWLLALLPALPHLYVAGEVQLMKDHKTCISLGNLSHETSTYQNYLIFIFTLFFYLPIVTGAIMYAVIFLKAKPWNWLVVSSDKFKMLMLSLSLYGILLLTSMPFVIEHNILYFSRLISTFEIDAWLYFVLLSRNAINPYIYVLFHLRQILHKRALERDDEVPLVAPCTEDTVSGSTQLAQETLRNE